MSRIINVDELVPEDIEFAYRGETYFVPGDLDTAHVFKLFQVFSKMREVMDPEKEASEASVRRASTQLHDTLLDIFKERQPELEALPFGTRALPIVVGEIIKLLNAAPEGDDADPQKPAPRRRSTTKGPGRAAAAKTK